MSILAPNQFLSWGSPPPIQFLSWRSWLQRRSRAANATVQLLLLLLLLFLLLFLLFFSYNSSYYYSSIFIILIILIIIPPIVLLISVICEPTSSPSCFELFCELHNWPNLQKKIIVNQTMVARRKMNLPSIFSKKCCDVFKNKKQSKLHSGPTFFIVHSSCQS